MKTSKLLAVAVVMTAGFVQADKVYLKSGSFLSGKVESVATGEVTFKSDDIGSVKVPVSAIARLEDAGEHEIRFTDETVAKKRLTVEKGAYLADGKPLDMASVKAFDPVAETWHGSVNVAYNAARGNTYDNTATVLANLNRRWEKDRINVDFGYYYGESGTSDGDNQRTKDKWEVEGKHDHFWLPKVYSYEDLKWERDRIQDLDARYRVGLGGGYQWLDDTDVWSTGKWSFNQELGLNWIKEEYENNDDVKKYGYCALRYGHHLNWSPVWTPGLGVFHNAEILPEVDQWEKFTAKCDLGLSTKVFWDINLLAKIEWEFNSMPANNRKRDDIRYILGLGYKW